MQLQQRFLSPNGSTAGDRRSRSCCSSRCQHSAHAAGAHTAHSVGTAQRHVPPRAVAVPAPTAFPAPQQHQHPAADPPVVPARPGAADVDNSMYAGKHAVIAGAGPCGTLSAILLAQLGFTVDVHERRPAPPRGQPLQVGPRSFCIMLHRRGLEAIQGAGVSLPPDMCLQRGRVVRFRGTQMYSTDAPSWSHSVNRDLLTSYLITQARERYPDQVHFHFDSQLEALALDTRQATLKSGADGSCTTVAYDFLIGADGANSRTRAQFAAQVPGFSFQQAADDMEYKTLLVPPFGDKTLPPAPYFTLFDEQRNTFFVCARDAAVGGRMRGVFVLSKGGFAHLRTQRDYAAALRRSFPAPFSEEQYAAMARQLVHAPLCQGGLNTQCSRIWGPSAVLVGDAAHSMWPTLGQGVNSALEDAAVLHAILKSCKGDLAAVPQAFHDARHKDMLAVVQLTQSSYGEGQHAISAAGIVAAMLLSWAAKLLPFLVQRPALSLMNETHMPYNEIQTMQEQQRRALNAAALALGVTAVGVPAALLGPLATAAASAFGN